MTMAVWTSITWLYRTSDMRHWFALPLACPISVALSLGAAAQPAADKLYAITDGKVDARTYNGFRRYHASCNHCHGPDGLGSTVGPSLVERPPDLDAFRRVVRDGASGARGVMKGFGDDPNVAPYVDDILAYVQARADGALPPGRPTRKEP
jgi:mono/diheme cytochrome c family protein